MKAILPILILLSSLGCGAQNDEQEKKEIDICTQCGPLTEGLMEGKKGKNDVEGGVIKAIFPASNADGVQLDTKVSIVFNRDIAPAELTSSQFYMSNSRGEEIDTTLVYDNGKATLLPLNNLSLLTTYTLTLEGIKTLAGRQVDKKTWKFTTRDGAWGTPLRLQIETRKESFGGKIVADQHGNAVAIWPQYENFKAQIWESHYETGKGWSSSFPLEMHGADYSATRFKLAMDAGGQATASWILWYGTGRLSYNSIGSSGWEDARTSDLRIIQQEIAMGENDQTLISAISENEDPEVFLVMLDSRTNETSSSQVLPCDGQCYYTEGAFDEAGNAYVVIERSRGEGHYTEILVGAFDGEIWETSLIKEAGNGDSSDPRLAMSKETPYVFWSQWGEDAGVWMRKFQGGQWLPEQRMSANQTSTNLKVESNISGDMVLTWTEGENNAYLYANIYMAQSGEWTGPSRIDEGDGELYAPGVVIDGQANVTLVWPQSKDYDYTNSLYSARYDSHQGRWSKGKKIEEIFLAQKNAPSLAVLSDGRVFLLTGQFENIWNSVVLEFK